MTVGDVMRRAAAQASEEYPLPEPLGDMLLGYVREGFADFASDGEVRRESVAVEGGVARLGSGSVICVVSLADSAGSPRPFRASGGAVYAFPDGEYEATYVAGLDFPDGESGELGLDGAGCGAVADYAAWRLLGMGGGAQRARADHFFQAYALQKSRHQRLRDGERGARRFARSGR